MFRRIPSFLCAVILLWMPLRALAFAVTPASQDISGQRGSTVNGEIDVINNRNAEQTFYLGSIAFAPNEASGSPQFIPYETEHSGLPEWIAFPVPSLTIPPNTKVTVPFTVAIPETSASGTVFAAITVSTAPSEIVALNGASVDAKVASLLFLTVEGETVERLALLGFDSAGDADGPFVLARSYAFRLQNQGNVGVIPMGTINLTDVFGRTILSQAINADGGRVLPMTTREYSGSVGDPSDDRFIDVLRAQVSAPAIGPITATINVANGSDILTRSFVYWFIPLHLILTAAMAVVLLLVLWKTLSRFRHRLGGIGTGSQ